MKAVAVFFIFLWTIFLALVFKWSALAVYGVSNQAMMPTLLIHDFIFVNRLAYGLRMPFSSSYLFQWSQPKRGDVIVFSSPFDLKSFSVRRVIGLSGDRIFFENENWYLNEKKILKTDPLEKIFFYPKQRAKQKDQYVRWTEQLFGKKYNILLKKKRKGHLIFGPYRVPPKYYFVVGDHRDRSQDSRTWPSQLKKAKGVGTFSRAKMGSPVFIPKGTLLRANYFQIPEYFETTEDAQLSGLVVDVPIQAQRAGLGGNVSAGHINTIEAGERFSRVRVSNPRALSLGWDENLVSEDQIIGRVNRVFFSCRKTLLVSNLACDLKFMRWDRTFLFVQ